MANYNYTVTVANSTFYGQNVFLLDGSEKPPLSIYYDLPDPTVDNTVTFDLSDASNVGHALAIGPNNNDSANAYNSTNGLTYNVTGSTYNNYTDFKTAFDTAKSGNASAVASLTWVIPATANADSWYFCGVHNNMGNTFLVPDGVDTQAPTSPSITINSGQAQTLSTSATLSLAASDTIGVTGYFVSETNTTPSAGAFTAITATTSYSANVAFTLSAGAGVKTVYAWFKDAADNISTVVSDTVELISSDTNFPLNGTISLAGGATTTSSTSITATITATDNIAVTHYYLSETKTTPTAVNFVDTFTTSSTSVSETVNFTLSGGDGQKIVYAWFKDAADNISDYAYDIITLGLPDSTAPASATISLDGGAASTTSYQVSAAITGTDAVGINGYYLSETNSTPSANDFIAVVPTTSLSITANFNLSVGDGTKTVYLWLKDAANNISASANDTIDLTLSATSDDIAPVITSFAAEDGATTETRQVILTFAGTDAVGIAGYYLSETANAPSSGSFQLITPTTSLSKRLTYNLSQGGGEKVVYLWLEDGQGNISNVSSVRITLSSTNAGIANYKIRESILQSNRYGFNTATTMPVNTNSLAFGPLQVSNTVTINGTMAVFNELDIIENGIVNIVGTLDLR